VLLPGGFDDTAEERIKHGVHGALDLGWNALAWDGPGQGGVLVEQGVTMRPDFESVLTPVVDWVVDQPGVDPEALVLVGRSLAGYFAPRGASGEPRIKALVCDPGQYDFAGRLRSMFKAGEWERVLDADPAMDEQLQSNLEGPRNRYMYGSRMAAMGAETYGEWLRIQANYTLVGRVDSIACPTLITEGEGDFASQGQELYDALTCEKEFRQISAAEGGGGHCCGMGQQLWQQVAFGWLANRIS
jgi:pimeloyl-ACP methyl ester carboxylesterase